MRRFVPCALLVIVVLAWSSPLAHAQPPFHWESDGPTMALTPDGKAGMRLDFNRGDSGLVSSGAHTDEIELDLTASSAFVLELSEFADHTSFHLLWVEPNGPHLTLAAVGKAGRYVIPFCRGQKATTAGVPFSEPLEEKVRGALRIYVHSPAEASAWHVTELRFEPNVQVDRPYPLGFTDLDGDGDADLLRVSRPPFDIIYVDDDDDMTSCDAGGDTDSDLVVVDKNMDGVYDGVGDFVYDPVDVDGDGDADYEFSCTTVTGHGSCGLRYVDYDDDNRMACLDFENFALTNEQAYTEPGSYNFDYAGSGFFLKMPLFLAGWKMTNPELFWENPIAWYDTDDDGLTEMVVRCGDRGDPDGFLEAVDVAFDADNDTAAGNESDLDWQLTFEKRTPKGTDRIDYRAIGRFHYPGIRGIEEVNPVLFKTNPWFRRTDHWTHMPYFESVRLATGFEGWDYCFLLVDEDDEDIRWEEMFSPHEAAGVLCGYDDKIGDRWELDADFSGKGRLYRAAFDGRLHLCGAEKGEWTVDYHALYHGSVDRSGAEFDEPPLPPRRKEENGRTISIWRAKRSDITLRFPRVRYSDTDGNGFIDRIEYDDDGEPQTIERTVDLLAFADEDNPHPDVCPTWDLHPKAEPTGSFRPEHWNGKRIQFASDVYDRVLADTVTWAERNWADALMLYRAAKAAGLTVSEQEPECDLGPDATLEEREHARTYFVQPGYSSLVSATTTAEKERNAYWLREKVFADILRQTGDEERRRHYTRLFYTGKTGELAAMLGNTSESRKGDGR